MFRLALFGEGNVNAAIMIQLSRPYRHAVPAARASRSQETLSAILPMLPMPLGGLTTLPHPDGPR